MFQFFYKFVQNIQQLLQYIWSCYYNIHYS